MSKKNIWADNKIPRLEFCTLETASKLLNLNCDDILNLSRMRCIKTYVHVYNCKAKAHILYTSYAAKSVAKGVKSRGLYGIKLRDLNHESPANEFTIPLNFVSHADKSDNHFDFTGYWVENLDEFIDFTENYFKEHAGDKNDNARFRMYAYVYLTGFINVAPDEIKVNGFSDYSFDECKSIDFQFLEPFSDTVFISANDVEKIYESAGRAMPRYDFAPPDRKDSISDKEIVCYTTERHAVNREALYKSAIYLLSKYPEECRGGKKEISPEKWRDCLISRSNEIPALAITNEEVILRRLRKAVNGN